MKLFDSVYRRDVPPSPTSEELSNALLSMSPDAIPASPGTNPRKRCVIKKHPRQRLSSLFLRRDLRPRANSDEEVASISSRQRILAHTPDTDEGDLPLSYDLCAPLECRTLEVCII